MMKKIFFALLLMISISAIVSSCAPSRKSGCPMSEGIIH